MAARNLESDAANPTSAPDAPLDLIEWRVDGKPTTGQNGPRARFVPYLKAHGVAQLLDGWVGQFGWHDAYEVGQIDGKPAVWCHLTVNDVTKSDVGTPSNFEGQKGAVSDAFKRVASLKWGVGRNVYRFPPIWAPCKVTKDKNGNDVAWPNEQTIPAIKAQLERYGFTDEGTPDVAQEPPEGVDENGEVEPSPLHPDVVKIREALEAAEPAVRTAFVEKWGLTRNLDPALAADATEWLIKLELPVSVGEGAQ